MILTTSDAGHAAIWISEDETDTEDEDDDEGQDFDDSQSCTTPTTSITDHLDSTGTKHSPTQLEAATSMNTMLAVSPARVEDDPIWTYCLHMNRTSAGDSMACIDASFEVSPTRPESEPCLSVSGEQQLVTEATGATSEPGIMIIDALSDEVCSSISPDDAIPGAHTPSPAVRLSPESQQDDAEPESSEAESRSPFRARVSPLSQELPSRRRSRRRSLHVYQTGSGSEDDDFDDEEHQDRKHRKVSRSPSYSICNAATTVAHSLRERDTSALGLLSPTPSHARSVPSEAIATKKTTKRTPARRAKYSDEEDNFLIQLKEEEQIRWAEIRRRFA
ncbi:hypothetical protein B0J13DRAFT_590765 [Dactylonectria estremocensis]|uniref:Uncharacterized protein n=1 Tax=Dactylonectria estremocensis TaxID=1079267 RepID=A0A9P9D604_9HYPO|nr:hypothetical protein B0J13DRAFT_590765 [Dactylonectria estremocensis]